MSMKYKKVLYIMITVIILILITPIRVNAGLQANKGGKSLNGVSVDGYFLAIRRMETQNGTLGKNAVLDDKYVDTTKNGIDSHMALNTEMGTAVILTFSEFGVRPTSSNDTTTGNQSGIFQLGYGYAEYTAGVNKNSYVSYVKKIIDGDSRYYNNYTSGKSISGDRIGIFGTSVSYPSEGYPITYIGYEGKMLSDYASTNGSGKFGNGNGLSSRAVVVCGTDL